LSNFKTVGSARGSSSFKQQKGAPFEAIAYFSGQGFMLKEQESLKKMLFQY